MSRRGRIVFWVIGAIAWWGAVVAAAEKPVVRVTVEPHKSVLVGQQVRITVQILVPNYFLSAPDWPTLDIDGAVVTMPDEVMPHLTETIGGDSYAGVQRVYIVTPQRDGDFLLPPVAIRFKYAAVPGQPPANGVVTLPPTHFAANLPEGAQGDEGAITVARVTVHQSFDRPLTGLKAGDALTRTVTSVIAHAQPMMIAPPQLDAPEGVRLYRKDPVLTTNTGTRGELISGTRVDRATYLFERPGHYTLPAIEIPWFDTATNTRTTATAAATVVDISANTATAPAIAPEAPPPAPVPPPPSPWLVWAQRLPWILGGIALLSAAATLWRRLWPRYRVSRIARRTAREHSEPAYFSRLQAACDGGDPKQAYAALARWAEGAGARTIEEWCSTLASAPFRQQVSGLDRLLFASGAQSSSWSGKAMSRAAAEARRHWREHSAAHDEARHALPRMNPRWSDVSHAG